MQDPKQEKSMNTEIVVKGMRSRALNIDYLSVRLSWVVTALLAVIALVIAASPLTPQMMQAAGADLRTLPEFDSKTRY